MLYNTVFVSRKMFWGRIGELRDRFERCYAMVIDHRAHYNDLLNRKLSRDEVKTCSECGHVFEALMSEGLAQEAAGF